MADWKVDNKHNSEDSTILKIVKVGRLTSNKRKAESSVESIKKPKMDSEDVQKLIGEAVGKSADAYKVILEENNQKIIAGLDSKLEPIANEVSSLSNKYDSLNSIVSSQGEDMSELKSTVESLKVSMKEDIVNEIEDKNKTSHLSAYKYTLSIENEKVANNLLIFGLKAENPKDAVNELLSKLSIPTEISYTIVSVVKLGKDGGERLPSILVKFQNSFQRNEILKYAKNLPKGVTFDRDIPMGYREQYKAMKRKAYKYRKWIDCSTQIIFVGHLMQLRYRDRENNTNKSYTIIEEYFPPPESMVNHLKGNSSKGGSVPSLSVNQASLKTAKCTLMLNEIGGASMLTIDAGLKQLLNKAEFESIQKIEVHNGSARILCNSPSQCKHIAKNYNGKSVNGLKLNFDTFDLD